MESFNSKLSTSSNLSKYRKKKNRKSKSPALSEILNLENTPFNFQFEPVDRKIAEHLKSQQLIKLCLPILRHSDQVSYDRDNYFKVQIDSTLDMEKSAVDNSLFLAVSRALLYKIFFFDDKYEFVVRKIISQYVQLSDGACYSDIILQENLRKVLCSYWLSFVENGAFKPNTKYSEFFSNVLEFIYQIYQISVNNFSNNLLFKKFAVEDLSNILNLKIILFNGEDGRFFPKNKKLKVCESAESKRFRTNDCVFLEKVGELDYQWLMPVTKQAFIKSTLVTGETKFYFFRVCANYSKQIILIEADQIKKALGTELKKKQNLILFQKFLSEIAVHSLISLHKIDFDLIHNCSDNDAIIHYLNSLWGKNHFNLKKVLKEIEPNRQIESESVERKKDIKSEHDTDSSFYDSKSSSEVLNSSTNLKFSIENLLNDISSFKNFESEKTSKKNYEYFQEEEDNELKAMCQLPDTCEKCDQFNSTTNDLNESLHDNLEKKSFTEDWSQSNSSECCLFISESKSKAFFLKKKSLDTCLNSLMKLSSSSSSEK